MSSTSEPTTEQAGAAPVPDRMRAITQPAYGEADVLELRELPVPAPGESEVLIRVRAAGVDPGVWHLLAGRPALVRLAMGLRRPRSLVPGSDLAGTIAAIGPGVTRFGVGDEVFGVGRGSFAEFALAREKHLVVRPPTLPVEQAGATAISATTAWQALHDRGRLQPGQRVLVLGAGGGVGTFAVQLARLAGAEVTGVCSTGKVDLVRSLGAHHVIDYRREDALAGAGRYDLIVDTAGHRTLRSLRRALQPRGILVIVGSEGGTRLLGGMSRQLRAALVSPFVRQRLGTFLSLIGPDVLATLAELLADGRLRTIVGSTYPLDAAADAVREVHTGHTLGKVVLTV
jgi:NADPH:quinone reductase-like Zn-dependent oxidoreductase